VSRPDPENWLYLKLFFAPPGTFPESTANLDGLIDRLLGDYLLPKLRQLELELACGPYFFIRYAEAGYHLRIRCRCGFGGKDTVAAALEARIDDFLLEHPGALGGVSNSAELRRLGQWQTHQYVPESEKYCGPHGLEVVEQHFQRCTELTHAALTLTQSGIRKDHLAMWMMGQTLLHLELAPLEVLAIVAGYAAFWRPALPGGAVQAIATLDRTYTERRDQLGRFLPDELSLPTSAFCRAYPQVEAHLGGIRTLFQGTLTRLSLLESEGLLKSTFIDHVEKRRALLLAVPKLAQSPLSLLLVLPNLIHMMNNRLGIDVLKESQLAYYLARALRDRFGLPEMAFELMLEVAPATQHVAPHSVATPTSLVRSIESPIHNHVRIFQG
jgi:thiopeptide-type bacteriocin biosynthesis protein